MTFYNVIKEEILRNILRIDEEYFRKYPKGKAMSLEELDKLAGVK